MSKRLRTSLLSIGAAAVAAMLGFTAAAATSTAPKGPEFRSASCTTDAQGICTVQHSLGVAPTAVLVSPATPAPFYSYNLNTVNGSYTPTTFQVRAMFTPTEPKAFGTIWFTYAAYAEGTTTPPPPPTSDTPTPPPTSDTPPPVTNPPASAGCASPEKIVEQDGRTFDAPVGQYYVHNDAWNWQGPNSGQHEVMSLCDQANWSVDSWGFKTPEGEVYMYPSSKLDVTGSCCGGRPLSDFPNEVTGKFAGTVSGYGAGSSYDVAWDLWLNGVASGNYTEMMIWTQTGGNAEPAGTRRADWTAPNGQVYEVWWDGNTTEKAGGSYLAFISKNTQTSGTVDIKAFIAEAASRGYINANPTLNQLNYGIEVRDTGAATQANPARFSLTDFGLTLK